MHALAASQLSQASSPPAYVIPFQRRQGHVLIAATVNGRSGTFILDTGSSLCTIDAQWAASAGLAGAGPSTSVSGASSSLQVAMANVASLRIGGLELRDERVALIPLRPVSEQHGREVAGTIGYPIFSRYVVEIDYVGRTLRLYDPSTFRYEGSGAILPIDIGMRIPIAHVLIAPPKAAAIDARLVLDLGTSRAGAILTAPFSETHAAEFAASRSVEVKGAGVGTVGAGSMLRLESLDIAGLVVSAPIAVLMKDRSGFFGVTWADGTLGAAILERTRMIVDYSRSRVILEPTPELSTPYDSDASGLGLAATGAGYDTIVVRSVAAGTPASEAGIEPDDIVDRIDGVAANGASLEQLVAMLRQDGKIREIQVRRKGKALSLSVRLRSRI